MVVGDLCVAIKAQESDPCSGISGFTCLVGQLMLIKEKRQKAILTEAHIFSMLYIHERMYTHTILYAS